MKGDLMSESGLAHRHSRTAVRAWARLARLAITMGWCQEEALNVVDGEAVIMNRRDLIGRVSRLLF